MIGFLLALCSALTEAAKDVGSKVALRSVPAPAATWVLFASTIVFLTPLFIMNPKPIEWSGIALPLVVVGVINSAANLLYYSALGMGELSLALPLITFTPIFLLLTGWLILGESVPLLGACGVLVIVAGAYLLNIGQGRSGLLGPFANILSSKASRMMLGVALLWSITSAFDKQGVLNSSPVQWLLLTQIAVTAILAPFVIKQVIKIPPKKILVLSVWGLVWTVALVTQMSSLQYLHVSYAIAIKRLSILFAVVMSYFLLQEKVTLQRGFAALLMVAGVAILAVS